MTKLVKKLFSNLQNKMIADLQMTKGVSHPVTKGDATELNWVDWLDKYLPKRYSVTKGKVVDSNGIESEEIDLIIFDKQYSPFVFNYNGITYITSESVYAVFEIKQNLNKANIEYSAKKAESVRKLYRTSAPIVYSTGINPPKKLHKIFAGLLTTSCEWVDTSEKLLEYLPSLTKNEELDIICSLDKISCRINYERNEIKLFDKKYAEISTVEVEKNKEDNILIHLFLNILLKLQIIGTVPAIEFDKYFGDVATIQEIFNESNDKK